MGRRYGWGLWEGVGNEWGSLRRLVLTVVAGERGVVGTKGAVGGNKVAMAMWFLLQGKSLLKC